MLKQNVQPAKEKSWQPKTCLKSSEKIFMFMTVVFFKNISYSSFFILFFFSIPKIIVFFSMPSVLVFFFLFLILFSFQCNTFYKLTCICFLPYNSLFSVFFSHGYPKLILVCMSCFSITIVNKDTLFIHLVNYISPSSPIRNWVRNSPIPVSKYPLQYNRLVFDETPNIFDPILEGLSQSGPVTNHYLKKISNFFLRDLAKAGLATNLHLKILDTSLGGDLQKTLYGFYRYPKYQSHSKETSQNASNFHNFSKDRTRPTDLSTDLKVHAHDLRIIS